MTRSAFATLLIVVVLAIGISEQSRTQAAESSVRWLATLDKAMPAAPGQQVMLAPQSELRFRIAISNFEGPRIFGIESLPRSVDVTVKYEGQNIDVVSDMSVSEPLSPGSLGPHEKIDVLMTVRLEHAPSLPPGNYAITLDLSRFFTSLKLDSGVLWAGRSKKLEIRRVTVRPPTSAKDWIDYYDIEGNFFIGVGQPDEAIPYLEQLVRLRPAEWQGHAALGSAYQRVGRLSDAANAFQLALPGWLKSPGRRGDIVPNNLAAVLLILGREADATSALRAAGLSNREIPERLRLLRAAPRH